MQITVRDSMNEICDISEGSIVLTLVSVLGTKIVIEGITDTGTDGMAEFDLLPTHTATAGNYRYDVQLTFPGPVILTVDSGTINILPDISA
jgi:hypothetical protein